MSGAFAPALLVVAALAQPSAPSRYGTINGDEFAYQQKAYKQW